MPLYTYNGQLLVEGSALATDIACCCDTCDSQTNSGGAGTTVKVFKVPARAGIITFTYEAFSVPDAFTVEAGGVTYVNTGSISGGGSQSFCKPEGVVEVTVTVVGPPGTAWTYTLGCPTDPC